ARHCGVPEIDLPDWTDKEGRKDEVIEKIIEKYESVSEPVSNLFKQKMCSHEGPYETLNMARIDLKEAEVSRDPGESGKIRLVFPGSFDPCHRNHVLMAKMASEKLGQPVHFEISVTNVDKPPIDFISLNQRLDSLKEYKAEGFMASICLTNAPLFLQKAALFLDSTFIIGADTLNRIFDSKYYHGAIDTPAILKYFREKNVRFMVFRRKSVELHISPEVLEFCEIIPLDEYEDDGISSTEIRRKNENNIA
ncbi:MAG: hypothetical protein QG610_56, partial [Euryarchaeota archaeon]|nr:hypothetical protein [Euryarchaeota archaeon]